MDGGEEIRKCESNRVCNVVWVPSSHRYAFPPGQHRPRSVRHRPHPRCWLRRLVRLQEADRQALQKQTQFVQSSPSFSFFFTLSFFSIFIHPSWQHWNSPPRLPIFSGFVLSSSLLFFFLCRKGQQKDPQPRRVRQICPRCKGQAGSRPSRHRDLCRANASIARGERPSFPLLLPFCCLNAQPFMAIYRRGTLWRTSLSEKGFLPSVRHSPFCLRCLLL